MVPMDSLLQNPACTLSLARLASVFSMTLDQFQNHMGENGKNVGSMNMEEFISNIWIAEEGHAIAAAATAGTPSSTGEEKLFRLPSLPKQGSLTLPPPLSRKTVDQVWSEIHEDQVQQQQQQEEEVQHRHNDGFIASNPRQHTFGEMTLEDFLVKAGVVRENTASAFGTDGNWVMGTDFGQGLELGFSEQSTGNKELGGDGITLGRTTGLAMPMGQHILQRQHGVDDAAMKRIGNNGCLSGKPVNGGMPVGGFADGRFRSMCTNQMENPDMSPVQYRMDLLIREGRRPVDGPVEKVIERRQRRMIKNRESAARSRARKQAYTIELEAELSQLKEENMRLRRLQEEEEKRKKKMLDALATRPPQVARLRRTSTGPW